MAKVYLVNKVDLDLSEARARGDIVTINDDYVYGDECENGELPRDVREKLINAARNFDTRSDYVLIAGDHLQLAIFVGLLVSNAFDEHPVKFLRFDRHAKGYWECAVPFHAL